jgi:hypothetical protein
MSLKNFLLLLYLRCSVEVSAKVIFFMKGLQLYEFEDDDENYFILIADFIIIIINKLNLNSFIILQIL